MSRGEANVRISSHLEKGLRLGRPGPEGEQKVPLGRCKLMPKSTVWTTEQGLHPSTYMPP